MPRLEDAIRYCAAMAATEEPIRQDPPLAIPQNALEDWVAKITDLLAQIDEAEALAILTEVEAITTALASGRYVIAVLAMIRVVRAIRDATTN